jgi:hypothetical protein
MLAGKPLILQMLSFFSNGGAYGMWIFHSGNDADCGLGRLAAVWYLDNGTIALSGNVRGGLIETAMGALELTQLHQWALLSDKVAIACGQL